MLSNLIKEKVKVAEKQKYPHEGFEDREREREINTFEFELIKFVKIYNTRASILPAPAFPLPSEFKKILQLTKELTDNNNSKLYFVYLPDYNRYKKIYDNTNYTSVKNIVNELKIPFIDIHKEVFENEQNPLKLFSFEQPGHYDIGGYKKVTETIYKFSKD